jgi:hypothetical protein
MVEDAEEEEEEEVLGVQERRGGWVIGLSARLMIVAELCRGDEEGRGLMEERKRTEIVYIAMKKIGMKQQ